MTEQEAHDKILKLCRSKEKVFKTRAHWGMRQDIALKGVSGGRVPCAVIDLERTRENPEVRFTYIPIVLASGNTWLEVYAALVAAVEVSL